MLHAILISLYVLSCLFLILVVLLQAGKGGGLGVALGGGASSVFGGRGTATFLTRLTGIVAGLFMVLSVVVSLQSSGPRGAVDPDLAVEDDLAKQGEDDEAVEATDLEVPAEAAEGAAVAPADRVDGEKPAVEPGKDNPAPAADPAKPEAKPEGEKAPEAAAQPAGEAKAPEAAAQPAGEAKAPEQAPAGK